jgi:hypothetical protein
MAGYRRQAVLAGMTVVCGAATSVVTNLVTDGWPVVLVAVLVGVVAVWIVVEMLALRPGRPGKTAGASAAASDNVRRRGYRGGGWSVLVVRQRARAGRNASVVQVAGDLTVPPAGGTGRRTVEPMVAGDPGVPGDPRDSG